MVVLEGWVVVVVVMVASPQCQVTAVGWAAGYTAVSFTAAYCGWHTTEHSKANKRLQEDLGGRNTEEQGEVAKEHWLAKISSLSSPLDKHSPSLCHSNISLH